MSAHVIIDGAYMSGSDYKRRAGCAVCCAPVAVCAKYPTCSKSKEYMFSIAPHDQKSRARARKARGRRR
jgi:hypothetical protein